MSPSFSLKHLVVTTDAAYEMMAALLQTAFPEQTILAYEIADSYCPGTYDLSIDGKKLLVQHNDGSKMAWLS